jgi:hypothetical protein
VIYPGSTPVGNATLVVANVLTCNKHSQVYTGSVHIVSDSLLTAIESLEAWNCFPDSGRLQDRADSWHGTNGIMIMA